MSRRMVRSETSRRLARSRAVTRRCTCSRRRMESRRKPLQGKIAVVAGSSRGAGRGIALALGDAGATVYVAARTSRHGPKPADGAPGTVEDTAEEVCARGGQGIPVRADLGNEEEAAGRLDLMVDSAWGATIAEWSKPFWELSAGIWRDTAATIDAAWLTSVH